jgi:hypothetical protein
LVCVTGFIGKIFLAGLTWFLAHRESSCSSMGISGTQGHYENVAKTAFAK